jgi:hypothetical protein
MANVLILDAVFPAAKNLSIQLGIPIVIIPVAVAAVLQLTGFVRTLAYEGARIFENFCFSIIL